ncbi:DHH family phosphoesterase [Vibrio algarum]|uniref:DHH family phosphoesterase n=1 Tax=Vibrio algarum TaxID=3020714 RepID=A0ABT4YSL2_9VIBR|nr:DHH family phosphoesterase [Vibrio sp. KJ40-1]MDB1124191.1 DHH family phosphoesterase [Vibrio sp. KJ40-1]
MASQFFELLLKKLDQHKRVIIQPHDFPDHDAVSSSFAMQYLLTQLGYNCVIVYSGYISRVSLKNMINWLAIDIRHINDETLTPDDKIIVMDGCIGERNVTDMPGIEVAVIDHHQVDAPDFIWYEDVRPDYGSTATIMVEYFKYFGLEIPEAVSTALLLGLMFDTNSLTRGVSPSDIKAMLELRESADLTLTNKIFRNQLEYQDLDNFKDLLKDVQRERNLAYCILPYCSTQMLGVLGDFLLSIDEVDNVVLITPHHQRAYLSLRSECPNTNLAKIIKKQLNDSGIGYGGGHKHMAAGVIHSSVSLNNLPKIMNQFRQQFRVR